MALLQDIVGMVMVLERLFEQLVRATLPSDSALAQELQRRVRTVTARFRMALTTAGMTEIRRSLDA